MSMPRIARRGACASSSSLATLMPPALPRPPIRTWALINAGVTDLGPPRLRRSRRQPPARREGTGTPEPANSCLPKYYRRSIGARGSLAECAKRRACAERARFCIRCRDYRFLDLHNQPCTCTPGDRLRAHGAPPRHRRHSRHHRAGGPADRYRASRRRLAGHPVVTGRAGGGGGGLGAGVPGGRAAVVRAGLRAAAALGDRGGPARAGPGQRPAGRGQPARAAGPRASRGRRWPRPAAATWPPPPR